MPLRAPLLVLPGQSSNGGMSGEVGEHSSNWADPPQPAVFMGSREPSVLEPQDGGGGGALTGVRAVEYGVARSPIAVNHDS